MRSLNLKYAFRTLGLGILISLTVLLANTLRSANPMPKLNISKELSALNLKNDNLKFIVLGHSRLISSLLWITTMIESDIDHYKGEDNSWMYYRFMSIANLDPMFYKNYLVGGQYLAIIKDDIYGADDLYRLGLKNFPRDFWLLYHAGFNATFEIGDVKKGLEYYDLILQDSKLIQLAPSLFTLINKLKIQEGTISLKDTFATLSELYLRLEEGPMRNHVEDSLYAIKAEIDLTCLESKAPSLCQRVDFYARPYLKGPNGWYSQRPWRPFRPNKKAPPKGGAE